MKNKQKQTKTKYLEDSRPLETETTSKVENKNYNFYFILNQITLDHAMKIYICHLSNILSRKIVAVQRGNAISILGGHPIN